MGEQVPVGKTDSKSVGRAIRKAGSRQLCSINCAVRKHLGQCAVQQAHILAERALHNQIPTLCRGVRRKQEKAVVIGRMPQQIEPMP